MKTFFITSTISIEAESRQAAIDLIERERHNEGDQSFIAEDLLANAEVDEDLGS